MAEEGEKATLWGIPMGARSSHGSEPMLPFSTPYGAIQAGAVAPVSAAPTLSPAATPPTVQASSAPASAPSGALVALGPSVSTAPQPAESSPTIPSVPIPPHPSPIAVP